LVRARRQGLSIAQSVSASPNAPQTLINLQAALNEQRLEAQLESLIPLRANSMQGHELLPILNGEAGSLDTEALFRLAAMAGLELALDKQVTRRAIAVRPTQSEPVSQWFSLSAASWQHADFLPWLSTELTAITADVALNVVLSEVDIQSDRSAATMFCQGLQQLGLGFAVSRFGVALTPFSWLEEIQLLDLAPTFLKLDAALVRDIAADPDSVERLRRLIDQAHALQLPVVAPEITDLNVLPLLWQLGVDYVQGAAFSARAPSRCTGAPVSETITTAGSSAAQESTWH
jgi:EAL domain-containing protein (putative c-di-GMP-specific phosphodiesterase class I)